MLTVIPHTTQHPHTTTGHHQPPPQGKRSSAAGGRIRSSCGYHHQRHQACVETCEGRKLHPASPHPPMRDKFSVGCPPCQAFFSEQHQEILSPVSKRLHGSASPSGGAASPRTPSPPHSSPSSPTLHSFIPAKFEDFSPRAESPSLRASPPPKPPSPQKLAILAHESELEYLQQYQLDLAAKRRAFEQEEALLREHRSQLDKLRIQQDTERQRIQQHQQVLDYQKHQQEIELQRIQAYQAELDEYRREQEVQRQLLKAQQAEFGQARLELDQVRLLQKKQEGNGLTIQTSPMFIPPMIEKSHSPNPTALATHPLEEENAPVHDRMVHVTSSALKRPMSDVMGNEAEEVSHKRTRRSG